FDAGAFRRHCGSRGRSRAPALRQRNEINDAEIARRVALLELLGHLMHAEQHCDRDRAAADRRRDVSDDHLANTRYFKARRYYRISGVTSSPRLRLDRDE